MPIELQIIRASEFIRLGAQGHFDLAASREALAHLARACRKRRIQQALLDLRALQLGPKPVFSPADIASLIGTFRELGFTADHRVAVLYSSDPHGRAWLFGFLGRLHGWNVGTFSSFEEAIVWLEGEEVIELEACAKEQRVPVKRIHRQACSTASHFSRRAERY